MIANALPEPAGDDPNLRSATPLTALVVSTDRALQRRLNHYLREAGYRAVHSSSVTHTLALVDAMEFGFLLVDSDLQEGDALELCREAGTSLRGSQVAKLLLQSNSTGVEFSDLLHAGIDDVLVKPPSYLELVARLRAAARTCEFRRRIQQQLGLDLLTQLPNEASLRANVEQMLAADDAPVCSSLLLQVDHWKEKSTSDGTRSANELVVALAELLLREKLENERVSYWGDARFCVVSGHQGAQETMSRAEELVQSITAVLSEFELAFPLSVSVGVADTAEGLDAADLFDQAAEALELAQNSGGNCICLYGEHDQEIADLVEMDRTGYAFQHTVAADLMTPCVLAFSESHGLWYATSLLVRHRLAAAPVIDSSGKCVGIIVAANLPQTAQEAGNRNVQSFRSPQAEMCGEETSLGDIMQRFSEGDTQWLVITRHGRPTGLISRDQLAQFSQPLTVESLRADSSRAPRRRVEDLVVAESWA